VLSARPLLTNPRTSITFLGLYSRFHSLIIPPRWRWSTIPHLEVQLCGKQRGRPPVHHPQVDSQLAPAAEGRAARPCLPAQRAGELARRPTSAAGLCLQLGPEMSRDVMLRQPVRFGGEIPAVTQATLCLCPEVNDSAAATTAGSPCNCRRRRRNSSSARHCCGAVGLAGLCPRGGGRRRRVGLLAGGGPAGQDRLTAGPTGRHLLFVLLLLLLFV